MKTFNLRVFVTMVAACTIFVACDDKEGTDTSPVGDGSVTGIRISRTAIKFDLFDQATLRAEVIPADATNKNITWSSDHPNIVSVYDGNVRAKSSGTAIISATTEEGNKVATCTITVSEASVMRCNGNTPGWGESLGEVSFATDQTWTIGNQTWSDAVLASATDKETYNWGGDASAINADGRNIPDYNGNTYKGHFFSWCAAVRFQDELCPGDWRLPMKDDFIALDIALGGNGLNKVKEIPEHIPLIQAIIPRYLNEWGAEIPGYSNYVGDVWSQSLDGAYWTGEQIDNNNTDVYYLSLKPGVFVGPRNHFASKTLGFTIRCIK